MAGHGERLPKVGTPPSHPTTKEGGRQTTRPPTYHHRGRAAASIAGPRARAPRRPPRGDREGVEGPELTTTTTAAGEHERHRGGSTCSTAWKRRSRSVGPAGGCSTARGTTPATDSTWRQYPRGQSSKRLVNGITHGPRPRAPGAVLSNRPTANDRDSEQLLQADYVCCMDSRCARNRRHRNGEASLS